MQTRRGKDDPAPFDIITPTHGTLFAPIQPFALGREIMEGSLLLSAC
jgi:hypothetical protein